MIDENDEIGLTPVTDPLPSDTQDAERHEPSPATETENNESAEAESNTVNPSEIHSEVNSISADLIRGHINTIILIALYERDKYGYEIINDIEAKSHGQYTLKQPTLYSALKRLENQGYIKAYWKTDEVTLGGRRKYFKLTESGKLMTEKNLSEWEYSRTIIDSLISDRAYDFSNPPPTPVDFSILRDSVSRVPIIKSDERGRNDTDNEEFEEAAPLTPQQIIANQSAETVESANYIRNLEYVTLSENSLEEQKEAQKAELEEQLRAERERLERETEEQIRAERERIEREAEEQLRTERERLEREAEETLRSDRERLERKSEEEIRSEQQRLEQERIELEQAQVQFYKQQQAEQERVAKERERAEQEQAQRILAEQQRLEQERLAKERAEEEARKKTHENYMRLISEPVRAKNATEDIVPDSDKIDSGKLMYNNRPETERDYKNLIDGIFYKTISNGSVQTTYHSGKNSGSSGRQSQRQKPASNSRLVDRGLADGVSITPSNEANESRATRTTYNKSRTLLKSSSVVLAILIIESIFCFIFRNDLSMGLGYPFAILSIGFAQFIVFAALALKGYGKNCVRPTGNGYIGTSVVLTVIGILIIALLSFLFDMNPASLGDVMKMLVIPSLTLLNLTVFAVSFKLFLGR